MSDQTSPSAGGHPGDSSRSVAAELDEAVGELVRRFGDRADEQTIRAVLHESYQKVAATARVRGYLAVLAIHRAADRLRSWRAPREEGTVAGTDPAGAKDALRMSRLANQGGEARASAEGSDVRRQATDQGKCARRKGSLPG